MIEYLSKYGTEFLGAVAGAAYVITLVGGTVFIILYVAGWEKGMKWTGILFVVYILFRAVLGVL